MKKVFFVFCFVNYHFLQAAIPTSTSSFDKSWQTVNNQSASMETRWAAVINSIQLAQADDFKKINHLAEDKEWYIRNAVLVGLDQSGSDMVYDIAKKLITDKSLVIRSAAADILMRLNNDDIKKIFSTEIEKKYNYSGSNSLWIRAQMMEHLAKNPNQTEKSFFIKYLHDNDSQLAFISTKALSKLTQVRFEGDSNDKIVKQWKNYARNQKW